MKKKIILKNIKKEDFLNPKTLKVQKEEHFCKNCDRYEPIDNDSGWCGKTKVSARNWCPSWK